MQINKNIAISDSGFIFNPSTGDSFSTNQVGMEIIRLLKENLSKEEVIAGVVSKFNVDEATVEKDLADFALMLNNFQLVINHE
ncbi:MAG: PqqD family protein [Flavobacteriia bacterium]|nr:PqqD family protein [Flavobacteriia bacterium]